MGASRLVRFPNWEFCLAAFLENVKGRKYQIAEWDCGQFVCEAVQYMTGRPIITRVNCYGSVGELIKRRKNPELFLESFRAVAKEIQAPEVEPAAVAKGDILVFKERNDARLCCGIMLGTRAVTIHPSGFLYVPRELGVTGFKI